MTRRIAIFATAALLAACGGGGTMTGTVTVQGGSAANIAVFVYGAVSTAAVTNAEGRFEAHGLPDGDYSVVAKVRGADVEELAVPVKMTGGKPETEPTLAFTLTSGTVTGKLVFADGSDAANVTVALSGAASRGTRTAGDGAFTFEKVPAGAYVVSIDLVDTREKRASVGVAVTGASQDVGELRMTPVGRIGGTVTLNGAPAGGVPVSVAGTELVATSDALGRFDFAEVPTGDATFVATAGAQHQFSATASTRVTRGANPDLDLALGDNQSRRGTLQGSVTFVTPQSPTVITVSVAGAVATATPDASGAFSMMVPEGDWDVVARAPFHPSKVIGRAHVVAGQTTTLEGAELSWYRPVFETTATLTSVIIFAMSPNTPWILFRTAENTGQRWFLFNTETYDLRVLANSALSNERFSSNAKYLGFVLSGELMLYEIATGTITTWGTGVATYDFSSDETILFAVRGNALERINLATGNTTRFPATGSATQISEHTSDRWLVRESSNDVTLVEPANQTAQVFTQVQSLSTYPTPWALTNCGTTCTLKVLPAAARAAQTVGRSFTTGPSVLTSPAEFPSFVDSGTYVIVQASNGNYTDLPTGTNRLQFSPDGKRYAFQTVVGGNSTMREEALPPTASPMSVAQSSGGFQSAYLSNSRFVALEQASPRRIFDGKATGTSALNVTIDSDVDSSISPILSPPLLLWPKLSANRWRAFLGDKATLSIDVDLGELPGPIAVRYLGADAPTEYATVSFDTVTTWVLDEKLAQVRRLPGGYGVVGDRSGNTEYFYWQRPGMLDFVSFGPEIAMGQSDPGVLTGNGFSANGERGTLAVTQDRHHLWLGMVRP